MSDKIKLKVSEEFKAATNRAIKAFEEANEAYKDLMKALDESYIVESDKT